MRPTLHLQRHTYTFGEWAEIHVGLYPYDDLMVESPPTKRGAHDTAPCLGEVLCDARRSAVLSARAMVEASGLSIDTVRSIESGRTAYPTFITVARLASVLKVNLDCLSEVTHVDERDS